MPFKKGQPSANPNGRPIGTYKTIRDENGKVCNVCKLYKAYNEFSPQGRTKGDLIIYRSSCKNCYNHNWKYRLHSTLSSKNAKNKKRLLPDGREKKQHIVSELINHKFLDALKEKQNGMCYWLNIPIDFTLKDKLRQPSLDRLDNSKGYDIDNVVLTTLFANTGRRDATIFEMHMFLKEYIKK